MASFAYFTEHEVEHATVVNSSHEEAQDASKAVTNSPSTPAFKKRHRGCAFCILDVENAPIPEFPPNEVVVGVITMEDVIEELLKVFAMRSTLGATLSWSTGDLLVICSSHKNNIFAVKGDAMYIEEILDETDEYVNIHNRIKVNMNASNEKLPSISSLQQTVNNSSLTATSSAATTLSVLESSAGGGSPATTIPDSEGDIIRDR
ncbi:hypothetical protein Dimus_025553 [Dionaea muscipula]